MFSIILVGFLPTDNGRSCVQHPYGCGNFWVLEKALSHGVGMQIHLRLVDGSHLAGYIVEADGSEQFWCERQKKELSPIEVNSKDTLKFNMEAKLTSSGA